MLVWGVYMVQFKETHVQVSGPKIWLLLFRLLDFSHPVWHPPVEIVSIHS